MESEAPVRSLHDGGEEQLSEAAFLSEGTTNGVEDPKRKGTKRVKSRFKGVFKCGKKFKAQIQTHGVQHYLGLFDTEEEAAKAYDTHARLVLGMKAKTNFDYDPRDVPDDSYLPMPSLTAVRSGSDENGSKNAQLRRSYVGMKVRKKSRLEAPTPVVMASSIPVTHNTNPQSRFNLSNLSRAMQQQQAQSHMLRLPAVATPLGALGDALDWSKHPYTPLEINAPMGYHSLQPMNEPDWRDQIYYWTGALVYSDEERCLVWTGRWLGSFTGRPLTEEFEASHNDFRYTGPPVEKSRVVHSSGIIKPVSGSYNGCYVADGEQGSELEKFEEQHVILEFEETRAKPPTLFAVYGHGESEFGFFILHGNYDSESGVLDMTRQYLPDGDPRCSMNLPQLKEYFKRLTGQGR